MYIGVTEAVPQNICQRLDIQRLKKAPAAKLRATMSIRSRNPTGTAHGAAALSATGVKQLDFLLTTKEGDFEKVRPDVVYSSPLQRALRSAVAAYPNHEIIAEPNLREVGADDGMLPSELRLVLKKSNVDLQRVPEKAWWRAEDDGQTFRRLQGVMHEISDLTAKGKKVAVVGHGMAFRIMVRDHIKPFPRMWGISRGWPRNFRPYYGVIQKNEAGKFGVAPAPIEQASVILLRHAHSKAQEASTQMKRAQKLQDAPRRTKRIKK